VWNKHHDPANQQQPLLQVGSSDGNFGAEGAPADADPP